jgi:hypothetical protein
MMRRAAILPALGAALAASAALAQQPDGAAAGAEDFVRVCTAALLAPGELQPALAARGLARVGETNLRPTISLTVYAGDGAGRTVTVNRQRFPDAVLATCQVSGVFASSEESIGALRAALEADPRLGRVDGETLKVPQGTLIATFKRAGNVPVLTVQVTASPQTTLFTMTHWDLRSGQ